MKNHILFLLSVFLLSFAPLASACEHTPLQHQHLLETYLEFPIAHDGIANCQHLDFAERGELILLSLHTPQGNDPITNLVFLHIDHELIAKYQIGSSDIEDVSLVNESHLPAFSYYSSTVGWMQYFIYKHGKGFVSTEKMDQGEMKPVRFFEEVAYDYLSRDQILINTYVGLDTEMDEILFLLGQADSTSIRSGFDIMDSSTQVLHYSQSTISLEAGHISEFTLVNEGDELAQMVIGSSAADLAVRFPYSFGERLVEDDGYSITLGILNEQHQIGEYHYLSVWVKDDVISKICLWVNP